MIKKIDITRGEINEKRTIGLKMYIWSSENTTSKNVPQTLLSILGEEIKCVKYLFGCTHLKGDHNK